MPVSEEFPLCYKAVKCRFPLCHKAVKDRKLLDSIVMYGVYHANDARTHESIIEKAVSNPINHPNTVFNPCTIVPVFALR